ncbi:MAG TPA: hypothetical protein VKE42_04850 [Candidatus Cybelea sp.]|nr:hypothetical protein [Candidatus Cybelea sp.]
MSRAAPSSPNTLTVTSDDGATIGTLMVSALGFIAFNTAGRSLGGFASMAAAMAALESAARQ